QELERLLNLMVFFFQAEDGIRDFHVTGVQTCALPISPVSSIRDKACHCGKASTRPGNGEPSQSRSACNRSTPNSAWLAAAWQARSEERRVGKECRTGG